MPDPAKILADFKPSGRPAGDRGADPRRAEIRLHRTAGTRRKTRSGRRTSLPTRRRPMARPISSWWPTATSWPTGSGCGYSDFFGQQTATPFSDNGPFVANLIGTLAGGDALIGLRSRGDSNRPFIMINQMQGEAEAKYRQTEQALQTHLDDVRRSSCSALRQGPAGADQAQRAGGDHAGAAHRDRRRAQGHRRYATAAARRAARPEPGHLAGRDRACACSTSCSCPRCWSSWRSCSAVMRSRRRARGPEGA